ncbi:MAG: hypothetical protein ACMUJM_15540 [bacterium]
MTETGPISITADALGHLGGGIVISLLDYATYRIANQQEARIARKKECIKSIDVLLEAEKQEPDIENTAEVGKDSVQYALNVEAVKEYLNTYGLIKLELPLLKKIKGFFKALLYNEKINKLTALQKLGVALGAEIIYDSLFGFSYYTHILKQSPIAAISRNLYQIPALFAGLLVGNAIKGILDWISTSKEEKHLTETIKELVKQTPIVDIVVNYQAPENVKEELVMKGIKLYGSKLTQKGAIAYQRLRNMAAEAADSVAHYTENYEKEYTIKSEYIKSRFDELTKGH